MTAIPPFMSLAPSPWTAPASIRPGRFPCAGTVSTWPASTTGAAGSPASSDLAVVVERLADETADELHRSRLVAALRGHVDELERPGGEVGKSAR